MSFYSTLLLAANDGVREPSPDVVRALFRELGLLIPNPPAYGFGNLADDVSALFEDPAAAAENPRFFCPDTLGFGPGIHVEGPDDDYEGPGWAVGIHGNGCLFPWEVSDLRDRVVRTPKLRALRHAVGERFGGRFVFPPAAESFLRERLIDTDGGWAWFISESL